MNHQIIDEGGGRLVTVEHFMNLSAEINYHLSAEVPNVDALLSLVTGPATVPDHEALRQTMEIVRLGYAQSRRKIGPMAVLHPLRTAALLSRSMRNPNSLDLLGALLHDKDEDLPMHRIPEENRDEFANLFNLLLDKIGNEQQWYLGERLSLLTREKGLSYQKYLVRLLDNAERMPDLLHVKLADRLDNTLDHHIHRPGLLRYNFYRNMFDLFFVPVYKGVRIRQYHFLPEPMEGALLLSQLFKNALFLSLMRITDRCNMDDTTSDLFDAIAVASIREAQWLTLELIATHDQSEMPKLRKQFLETMEYCYHGGATQVHQADDQSKGLAGFFIERFATARGDDRRKAMLDLYNDREYLTRVIVTFIAVFSAFLNDPDFSIEGIDRDGVHAVDVDPTLRDNES